MKKALLYIHGNGGNASESEHYNGLLSDCNVFGLDYKGATPWDTKDEIANAYNNLCQKYDKVGIIANSIGAFFAMNSLKDADVSRAFFISPIVDMERLITDMMKYAGISEERLKSERKITTDFGETLSWEYLSYVRKNPINWTVPTDVLYGDKDDLTSFEAVKAFCNKSNASLTVMKGGEHWFHTKEQMDFLVSWFVNSVK